MCLVGCWDDLVGFWGRETGLDFIRGRRDGFRPFGTGASPDRLGNDLIVPQSVRHPHPHRLWPTSVCLFSMIKITD